MPDRELYDLTIIGGGPAGLYAAFYSGMRLMKTKIVEAADELGGVLQTFSEKFIWDVGGTTPIRAQEFIQRMVDQALTFSPTVVLGQRIADCERLSDGTLLLKTETGELHWTRAVLIAAGCGVFRQAKLEIEGAERYEVSNLYYTVQRLEQFRNKRVLISGGGDTAVDWANELEAIAAKVTIVHRRQSFGGYEQSVRRMERSTVAIRTPFVISSLHANASRSAIEAVSIIRLGEDGALTGIEDKIAVDAVIVNHGLRNDLGKLTQWGKQAWPWPIPVSEKMETDLPGVFCAGDIAGYPTKVRLIATAFADAVTAVNHVKLYLDPYAKRRAEVSSHNEIFAELNKSLE
ncbi:thioredoxin reductase [Cohnella sp. CIP 111063]|uniref:NAD(P)/FAD-dependent oxidoreductase n=1 Tax=unclassified Cohnella TaxID=2636738 RepID=UPI000B8C4F18|nr:MULTISPECIES: NAD(P)/FAD-dependent oxidoreductase [unclassified Cohnella]OXS54536.1 thioredoxin reductase [Cohnella sp. CIP 111063]PRX64044.1 thioredoxin reductase (NADPH) [Cohnella sp. SGD-V74]